MPLQNTNSRPRAQDAAASPSQIKSAAQILTLRAGGTWCGNTGKARCPICDVAEALILTDGDRKPIWRCLHGCDRRAISSIFRRRGLYNGGRP
jgi:hypothetical protein